MEFAEQGTAEWFKQRYGNASASRIKDIIAKTKSGYSSSRENYMVELVLERFGVFQEPFSTAAIEWGKEQEIFAKARYEIETNRIVNDCGYILHPSILKSGASPDGLIDENGVLEIKCPNTKTHFEYLIKGVPPSQYIPQMAWQMACTKREFADFVSYDPRAPEGLDFFTVRYERDEKYIEMLENEVSQFLIEVENKFLQLQNKLNEMRK